MTLLEGYVFFALPIIAIAMGFGALWLTNRSAEQDRKNHVH